MLINLAFIPAANGVLYFAMDYMAELEAVSLVLVRTPEMATVVERRFPDVRVRVTGARRAALAILAASRRGEMIFTPSPHPIPGIGRQMVVVHDTYPFEGAFGAFKAALFFLSMRTSRASAGYINVSDARAFLERGGMGSGRILPSPNLVTVPDGESLGGDLILSDPPVVGLFGTDSTKKNYERLFAGIALRGPRAPLRFKVYGQRNDYVTGIIDAFPGLEVAVSSSSEVGLEEFVRSVDLVASAAVREGFSRPIAFALSLGVPCLIVDAPVFREFYGGAATFHDSVETLGRALVALGPGEVLPRPAFTAPAGLEQDFRSCVAWLNARNGNAA